MHRHTDQTPPINTSGGGLQDFTMLKELWRKTLGQSVQLSSEDRPHSQVRLIPHLTHTGEFHLERLTKLLCERYGQSFDENQDESIHQLIHYAARVQDQDIQREFLLFFLNCSPVIQDYLCSEGIIGSDHFLSTGKKNR